MHGALHAIRRDPSFGTLVCDTDVTTYVIEGEDLRSAVLSSPKLAEEMMTQSIMYILLKKFGNELGMIQWMSSDPEQSHTVSYNVLSAIKEKAAVVGAQYAAAGARAAPVAGAGAGAGMDLVD